MRVGIRALWKSPMKPEDLKPIEYRQLCALLRSVLQSEPTIDDAEWKARTADTLAKWGFKQPNSEQIGRAMAAVEHAMRQTMGPRPIQEPPATEPAKPPQEFKESRTNRPQGWDIVVRLMAKLQGSTASGRSSAAPDVPRETLPISEEEALNEFWRGAWREDVGRLALLKVFAEIAIVRPADWDYAAVRAAGADRRLSAANGCFVCGGESSHWHHVIQIQFGGSNYVRNMVPLCAGCHGDVHPWLGLAPKTGRTGGWTNAGDMAAAMLDGRKAEMKRPEKPEPMDLSPAANLRRLMGKKADEPAAFDHAMAAANDRED